MTQSLYHSIVFFNIAPSIANLCPKANTFYDSNFHTYGCSCLRPAAPELVFLCPDDKSTPKQPCHQQRLVTEEGSQHQSPVQPQDQARHRGWNLNHVILVEPSVHTWMFDLTGAIVVCCLVFAVCAVAYAVAHEVGTYAEHRIALEGFCAAKGLRVLESRDNKSEPIVLGAPAVRLVAQGYKVGPRDDEPLGADGAWLGVAGDVRLK